MPILRMGVGSALRQFSKDTQSYSRILRWSVMPVSAVLRTRILAAMHLCSEMAQLGISNPGVADIDFAGDLDAGFIGFDSVLDGLAFGCWAPIG